MTPLQRVFFYGGGLLTGAGLYAAICGIYRWLYSNPNSEDWLVVGFAFYVVGSVLQLGFQASVAIERQGSPSE